MVLIRPPMPLAFQMAQGLADDAHLFDRIDRTPIARVGRRPARMARAANHCDRRDQATPAGGPYIEAGCFRDDRGIGGDAVRNRGCASRAGRFLVRHGADEQVAGQADPKAHQRFGGNDHRRDTPFHVDRATAVQPAVPHLSLVGIAGPAVARLGGDDVDVPVEEQTAAMPRARKAGQHLRTPLECKARRYQAATGQVLDLRLPDFCLRAHGAEPLGKVLLKPGFVSGWRADLVRRRVKADQVGRQGDQVLL